MKQAGEPLNAGKIAELSGLDRKDVDKAMKVLKEEGPSCLQSAANGSLRNRFHPRPGLQKRCPT